MLAFLSLEPYKRVREHFRGWGLDPKVQSPTKREREMLDAKRISMV